MSMLEILCGDALEKLRELPGESVHCCVTSPPYWSLRDYSCEGQLGLEKTPEEYVAKMVEVFREVRRVLRRDGTLWLNLGDSYAAQGGKQPDEAEWAASQVRAADRGYDVGGWGACRNKTQGAAGRAANTAVSGLKPKDLCGIPWEVVKAMQRPYYTGKIKDERDRVWLAAMIDAEGCMFIHKRKTGQSNGQGYQRKNDSYGASLEIANTSELITNRCLQITGRGSVFKHEKDRRQPLFRWSMRSNECRDVIREIYPYLTSKLQQARILLNCPSSGEEAEKCHRSMIALHNGQEPCIDYDTPPTLYEKGWYLRSDIIWSKLNPMPESVTDRPTKAHEYLFLLTKSANYFYDSEAIREDGPSYFRKAGGYESSELQGCYDGRRAGGFRNWDVSTSGRNKRSVWTIATQPYPEAHFATFPEELPKICILAGTSAKGCCAKCGSPWERIVERGELIGKDRGGNYKGRENEVDAAGQNRFESRNEFKPGMSFESKTIGWQPTCKHFDSSMGGGGTSFKGHSGNMKADGTPIVTPKITTGWSETCECESADVIPCTVLDPFAGSGTTGAVALELGRKAILIELNSKYVELIKDRCNVTPGLALA